MSVYELYWNPITKKKSPLADEMEKYGLKATDNEALNAQMLKNARAMNKEDNSQNQEVSYSSRPWADLIYQLDLTFHTDPKDDIDEINDKLDELLSGINDDEELTNEIEDLRSYVSQLYVDYQSISSSSIDTSQSLTTQLNNIAVMNTLFIT